jgi:hypothetical protein
LLSLCGRAAWVWLVGVLGEVSFVWYFIRSMHEAKVTAKRLHLWNCLAKLRHDTYPLTRHLRANQTKPTSNVNYEHRQSATSAHSSLFNALLHVTVTTNNTASKVITIKQLLW